MAPRLVGMPSWQFFDDTGAVLAGGTLDFFEPGTSTPKSIYTSTDSGGSTHTNQHTLDSSGRPTGPMFGDGLYDVVVKDSLGNTIETISNWGDNASATASENDNLISNPSFETDSDADDVPDDWTISGTFTTERSTSTPGHGSAKLLCTLTGGAGSNTIDSAFFEVSPNDTLIGGMKIRSSAASYSIKATLLTYDNTQTTTGSSQDIYDSTANPTSWTDVRFSNIKVDDVDSTSRWAKLRITIDDNGQGAGAVELDQVWMFVRRFQFASTVPSGLILSRDAGDTDHDINVTAGNAKASDEDFDLFLESEITKQVDATWALGDDAGGVLSGFSLPADGVVPVFLFGSTTDGGATDVGFDDDYSSPSLPTGYDKSRYIGTWPTDSSSNLMDGFMYGNRFVKLDDPAAEFQDTTIVDATIETSGTLNAPPYADVDFLCRVEIISGAVTEFVAWVRPSNSSWGTGKLGVGMEGTDDVRDELWFQGTVNIGADRQIDYGVDFASHGGDVQMDFYIVGWRDNFRDTA